MFRQQVDGGARDDGRRWATLGDHGLERQPQSVGPYRPVALRPRRHPVGARCPRPGRGRLMPFRSMAQQKWMYAITPAMAAKWQADMPKGKKLPKKAKKKPKKRKGY